jgi:hypothetical protein
MQNKLNKIHEAKRKKQKKTFFLLPLLLSGAFHLLLVVLSFYSWNYFWRPTNQQEVVKNKTDRYLGLPKPFSRHGHLGLRIFGLLSCRLAF